MVINVYTSCTRVQPTGPGPSFPPGTRGKPPPPAPPGAAAQPCGLTLPSGRSARGWWQPQAPAARPRGGSRGAAQPQPHVDHHVVLRAAQQPDVGSVARLVEALLDPVEAAAQRFARKSVQRQHPMPCCAVPQHLPLPAPAGSALAQGGRSLCTESGADGAGPSHCGDHG